MLLFWDSARRSLPSWASAVAFTVLAAVLAATGRLPWVDALWASASVLVAFVSTGWYAPTGWRRRAAESLLLPAAITLALVADLTVRRMLLPPLLVVAAAVALAVALAAAPERRRPLLIGAFGVAARAAVGVGLLGCDLLPAAVVLAVSAVLPWSASHWGRRVGVIAALVMAALPLQDRPLLVVAVTLFGAWLYPWARRGGAHVAAARSWLPAVAAAGLVAAAIAPWGGLAPTALFPQAGWLCVAAILLALAVTPRLPPALAGAVWLVAFVGLGPVQGPSPERRSFRLTSEMGVVELPAGTGAPYVVDISLRGGRNLEIGTVVAGLSVGGEERLLRVGEDAVDRVHARWRQPKIRHPVPGLPVWRPSRAGTDAVWRVAARSVFEVAEDVQPLMWRQQQLAERAQVVVEVVGGKGPTAPRRWTLPYWLWATAGIVALLQIVSGGWRSPAGWLPWSVLAVGQIVSCASVEPLRLVGERHAVDLALAGLLIAWAPAAWRWLRQGQVFRTAAALLLPLALATPQLTPPMYGDEPYHLAVMESLVHDRDLDLANNIEPELRPSERSYTVGDQLLHSPLLAMLLMPGYLLAGRTGALLLLALAGAALVALLARRARELGLPERRRAVLVLVLMLGYPVATYATQIWVELPGALAVAAIVMAAARPRGGRWLAVGLALAATAMKTRLALISFPAAAAVWWSGERRRSGLGAVVLLAAAALSLGVGWLAMGHPFGFFRRLGDLLPTNPGLALRVLGGLAFDPAGGLAFTAPLLLVSAAAAALLWRRGGAAERAVVLGGVLTVLALLHSEEWYGGGSPPARYLVPLLPVMALSLAMMLRTPQRWRRLGELLVAPSVIMWWALVSRPHFSINPGDGGWWLADATARRLVAETRALFPSFLVPTTATFWLPLLTVAVAAGITVLVSRRPRALPVVLSLGVALWLAAAAGFLLVATLRNDRVVEVEAPQVRRRGGQPVPPPGTVSRFRHRRGWQLGDGDGVIVPLKLPPDAKLWLEGWLLGNARQGAELAVRWDDGETIRIPVRGSADSGRVRMPDPPPAGRHRLQIVVSSPPAGAAVLDRVIVERHE